MSFALVFAEKSLKKTKRGGRLRAFPNLRALAPLCEPLPPSPNTAEARPTIYELGALEVVKNPPMNVSDPKLAGLTGSPALKIAVGYRF
jgi:hypothetical protein